MKSAVFYGKHDLKIMEVSKPQPKAKEVLVKVMACGVCGTDVHIFQGDKGAADCPSGTILGHEFAGVVEAVGEGVTAVNIGDRVCIDPNKLCGECYFCKNGVGHFCTDMMGIGTTVNGGFSEYCVIPESQAYQFSEAISFEEAAMTEPVACCLHGMDMCEVQQGSNVVIIGAGMIGLIMLQLTKNKGAAKLIMVEPVESKREEALKLGADIAINPFDQDVLQTLREQGIVQVDTVIECCGLTSTIEQAISIAGKKSIVMMFGLTKPDDTISVKPFEIFQKEITLKASFINPYTQQRALSLIENGKIDVKSMIAEVASLDRLPEVLASAELRKKGKYIIKP